MDYVASMLDFSFYFSRNIDDFITEGFGGNALKGKVFILWNCAARAVLWLLWRERNSRIFEDKRTLIDSLFVNIKNTASWWASIHKKVFCNHSLSLIMQDWKVVIV